MTTAILPGCEPLSLENGPLGVLVLHGFSGNPSTMRSLAERIAEAGYSVELPRLPGHGTSIDDFMTTTWSDWSSAALTAYDELAGRCDAVAVVGLSMGGGLATFIAQSRPGVVGCVLINPMIKPLPLEILEGLDQLIESGVETVDGNGSDIKSEDPREYEAAYASMPLVPLRTLFEGVTKVYDALGLVACPVLLLTSREDHTIYWDRAEELLTLSAGPVEQIWLENSYHVATLDHDAQLIESSTVSFLDSVLKS